MARVDAEDDDIRRFVVWHYRYDPERRERRHVLVAAFDDQSEFEAYLRQTQRDLKQRRAGDPGFDPQEHVSGTTHEPGHRRRAANGRLIRRAMAHGVVLGDWIDELSLPSSSWVMGFGASDAGRSAGSA
jgi:hypothetical protein